MSTNMLLKVGDVVEDHRPKSVFCLDPTDTYGGSPGKVTAVCDTGFQVEWEDDGCTGVWYMWNWIGNGMKKREGTGR